MPKAKPINANSDGKRLRPAKTTKGRESQVIGLAWDLAAKQLEEGTASSQVITYFLKLGSDKTRLEILKLENEAALMQAKKESIESEKKQAELFDRAIAAMKEYSGHGDSEDD
jgi:hypothetical protein